MYLPPKYAELIVDAIIGDIQGRCGIGDCWDNIEEVTRQEIEEAWMNIVMHFGE